MVQVICEKTGLTFEAKTTRTQNHPAIMNALSKAEKGGFYREAITTLEANKGKLRTIEEYVSLVENTGNAKAEEASAKFRAEYEAREAAKEVRREQEALRQKLARAGYLFDETMYNTGDDENEAYSVALFAPDGGRVTVEQALAEIANPALAEARIAEMQEVKEQTPIETEQATEKTTQEQATSALPKNPTPADEPDLFLLNVLFKGTKDMDEQPRIVEGSEEDKKLQAATEYWTQSKQQEYHIGQIVKILRASIGMATVVAEITKVDGDTIHAKLHKDGISYEYSPNLIAPATSEDIQKAANWRKWEEEQRTPQPLSYTTTIPENWDRFDEDGVIKRGRQ